MKKFNIEDLGKIIDRLDNCSAGLSNPYMPAEISVEMLSELLPEISKELKGVFYSLGGDVNMWDID